MLAVRFFLIFSYDLDLDGAEFTFVHYIQQLLRGQQLYLNPEAYPYSAVIYTPLYLNIVFYLTKLFHLDYIKHIHEIYIIGRSVSFACVLVCIYVVDLLIQKYTLKKLARVCAIFVFLNLISGHAFVMRPDGMKILFFIAFFYHYLSYFYYTKSIKNIVLLFLFLMLSFLSKQDVVVYILLVQLIHLLFEKKRNVFLVLIASILLIFISVYALKILFGEYVFVSLFEFNLQTISDVKSSYNLLVVLFSTSRILPVCVVVIYSFFYFQTTEKYFKTIAVIGFTSCIVATFFLFRPGSYINYTYESLILLMFAFFLLFQKYFQRFYFIVVLYFMLFFISNLAIKNYTYFPSKEKKCKTEYATYYSLRKQISPLLEKQACLFAPNLKLSIFFADKNIIYGQEYHLDRLIYANLGLKSYSKLKLNSSDNYDKNFENGTVKYLLAFDKETEREVIKSAYSKYVLQQKINQFLLYKFHND